MRLAIVAAAISPYHDARYRAAASVVDELFVVANSSEGEFAEFAAKRIGRYSVSYLFNNRADYEEAVAHRCVFAKTRACLEALKPDAVAVAGWASPEGLVALEWVRERGLPGILMSESQSDDAPRSAFRELVKRRVVANFDAALVGGPSHSEYVTSLGMSPRRVHMGYNAVDNMYFYHHASLARLRDAATRARYALPARYILASARFVKKKNLPALVEAFASARREFKDFPDLVILGDGPLRGLVEGLVADLGLAKSVHLPGFRGYDDLPAYYGLAEVFCHVSTTEQWGLVINEAMAAGTPVIVSAACGAARTVVRNGQSGFVVQPTVEGISAALVQLFSLPLAPRLEMGQRAAEGIANWGPERFGAGMAAALQSAGQRSRRGRLAPWDRAVLSQLQKRLVTAVA